MNSVDYKKLIVEMVQKTKNQKILVAIYTYVKTLVE